MYINGRFHEIAAWNGQSSIVPPGDDYVFQIEEAIQKASSGKGVPQLQITVVVCNEGEMAGRKSNFWYSMNFEYPQARSRIKALAEACGIQFDANGGFEDTHFIGKRFMADVVNKPFEKTNASTGEVKTVDRSEIQNERPFQQQDAQPGALPPGAMAMPQQQQQMAPQQFQAPVPMAAPAPSAVPVQMGTNPAFPRQNNNSGSFPTVRK